jgi:transcription initiation factor IIE alpha subunit
MAIFICPNCEQRSEIKESGAENPYPHVCPHCGQQFKIDKDINSIVEE